MGIHIMPPIYKLVIEKRYGPQVTVKYYPTLGHAGVAADGIAYRFAVNTWANLRNGNGTTGSDTGTLAGVYIESSTPSPYWVHIRRAPLHFDTTNLPIGCQIDLATVGIIGTAKATPAQWSPSLALVNDTDPTPGEITASDYQLVGTTLIAPKISYASYNAAGLNVFTVDSARYALIIPGGVTQFALREGEYDLPNIEPAWLENTGLDFIWQARDAGLSQSPYLEVTYRELIP